MPRTRVRGTFGTGKTAEVPMIPGADPQPADVIQIDPVNDLALLRIAQTNLAPIETGGSEDKRGCVP